MIFMEFIHIYTLVNKHHQWCILIGMGYTCKHALKIYCDILMLLCVCFLESFLQYLYIILFTMYLYVLS